MEGLTDVDAMKTNGGETMGGVTASVSWRAQHTYAKTLARRARVAVQTGALPQVGSWEHMRVTVEHVSNACRDPRRGTFHTVRSRSLSLSTREGYFDYSSRFYRDFI